MNMSRLTTFALVALLVANLTAPAYAVTIDWVTVGDPNNAADTTGYGTVANAYRIGKYEVTIQQYTDFLNAVAQSDPYSLYDPVMANNGNIAGISQSGTSGGFSYSVIGPVGTTPAGASSPGNRPITFVSWFDAARFANWMQNGQGSGGTETGAYTLVGGQTSGTAPAKNPGAQYYIPTENEWYKAAYYKGGSTNAGYWDYATQSDTDPGNTIGGANQANYFAGAYAVTGSGTYNINQNYLTDVGAFTSSLSAYGTFDQSGNVYEWNDLAGSSDLLRGLRGGDWNDTVASDLGSSSRTTDAPSLGNSFIGFRLASPVAVPEPSVWVMGLAGIACAGWEACRRRRVATTSSRRT
ncbi:MAG: formylglycine-generating enzyme family protein [Pirellulales bacterium]